MQGLLSGTRYSRPIGIPELGVPFAKDYYIPFFRAMRGEMTLTASGSAQEGLMPTLNFFPQARLHLLDLQRGMWLGGGFARTFDGEEWRTAMIDLPVFTAKDGEGLFEQLLASQPDPATGG